VYLKSLTQVSTRLSVVFTCRKANLVDFSPITSPYVSWWHWL